MLQFVGVRAMFTQHKMRSFNILLIICVVCLCVCVCVCRLQLLWLRLVSQYSLGEERARMTSGGVSISVLMLLNGNVIW